MATQANNRTAVSAATRGGVGCSIITGGGKWVEITYGRPIKRGRNVFGSGADYGKTLNAGAPVWRAGANQATRVADATGRVLAGARGTQSASDGSPEAKTQQVFTTVCGRCHPVERITVVYKPLMWNVSERIVLIESQGKQYAYYPSDMETKIFARLSAWQNWIFQRPNAVGPAGALRRFGTGSRPDYDRTRV